MAKHKFIAKINLKGDFEADDGLGVVQQEIEAGQPGSTDDKKLYDSLLEQGYIKSAKDAAKEEAEEPAASTSKPPPVKSTDKTDDKK